MIRPLAAATAVLFLFSAPSETAAQSFLDKATELLKPALGGSEGGAALGQDEIANGLREALRIGAQDVTQSLGRPDGFFKDPVAFIPLPDSLRKARDLMKPLGLGGLGDEVEERMNRGAEAAMPAVRDVLVNAVAGMTLDDARAILNGPQDAATQYLRRTGGPDIENRLRPIIEDNLREVGALNALESMLAGYQNIPFAPKVTASLTDHATQASLDGLFHYIGQEEAAIRENPAKRSTELLQKVFAQ